MILESTCEICKLLQVKNGRISKHFIVTKLYNEVALF